MANNFVGIVTRQEKNSGVTLRARITSPREKVSKYQDFKCMIKKAGLTDAQAVIAALKIIVDNLNLKGINNLSTSITSEMPNIGEYDTRVDYTVVGDEIKDYFSTTGRVIKRPAFGENIVLGDLTITVSKNNEVATQTITVGINPYTEDEIREFVAETLTWDLIKLGNASYDIDPKKNGYINIKENLDLVKSINDEEKLSNPITITWSVNDAYATATNGESRINSTSGNVLRLSYPTYNSVRTNGEYASISDLFEIVDNRGENGISGIGAGWFMRVGGLTLTATPSLTGSNIVFDPIQFKDLATLSSILTNKDVSDYLKANFESYKGTWFSIIDDTYGETFIPDGQTKEISSMAINNIKYAPSTGASILKFLSTADGLRRKTANNTLIDKGFEINFNPPSADGSVSFYEIDTLNSSELSTSVSDIDTLGSHKLSTVAFNSKATTYTQVDDYYCLEFNSNNSTTNMVAVCKYTIDGYAGATTQLITGFKFNLSPV